MSLQAKEQESGTPHNHGISFWQVCNGTPSHKFTSYRKERAAGKMFFLEALGPMRTVFILSEIGLSCPGRWQWEKINNNQCGRPVLSQERLE